MARQSTTPVQFNRQSRRDKTVLMSSGRAGQVIPCGYIPLLRGDSASGKVGIDIKLNDMPRPLLNAVYGNFQAWFVPKSSHPQFGGLDDFIHSYQGEKIRSLGQPDRDPPEFFAKRSSWSSNTGIVQTEFYKTLGLHNTGTQADIVDAFNLIYNFRLAAHSSALPLRPYVSEDIITATQLPRAFWPTGANARVVADYERALLVGNLDLDVSAGQIPIQGLGIKSPPVSASTNQSVVQTNDTTDESQYTDEVSMRVLGSGANMLPRVIAEMAGRTVTATLADIDSARAGQSFARLRASMAGADTSGYDNDDMLIAELMQGFNVPDDAFKRPWLLDSKRVPFNQIERHATDAANLDQSLSEGMASATLSLNVPVTDVGGTIFFTCEVLPEQLHERANDQWAEINDPKDLPNALRDVQRTEPVDYVLNKQIDARHTDPDGIYGFQPMNNVYNRDFTRLGGSYWQQDPANPFMESRSAIWHTNIVDPTFTDDHYLCPEDFPHFVFSDPTAPAFEFVCRHDVSIVGLTQIGDTLVENNDDYIAVRDLAETGIPE